MNQTELLSIILECELLDLNASKKDGRTALHDVALLSHLEVADVLLEYRTKKDVKDRYQDEPIALVQRKAHMELW